MPRDPDRGVWEELRRRRLLKVMVAYLAVAFALAEIVWFVSAVQAVPQAVARIVLGAIVMGFPTALVLAWTYDITSAGVVKTPDSSRSEEEMVGSTRSWMYLTLLGVAVGIAVESVRH